MTTTTPEQPIAWVCQTCGTQYPPSDRPSAHCRICDDDRQYVPAGGQQWTMLEAMRGGFKNRFREIEPGVSAIVTEPHFAIGQNAYLIETNHGNILWDLVALIDDATIAEIERRGGVQAIAISHAHFYTTMIEWSHALGHVPILLHESNRQWVMRPDSAVEYWSGDTMKPLPGVTVLRTGGHFPGGMVLHWSGTADGKGALFTGDIVKVVADPKWVTFLYSYPNTIPLDAATVARIATQLSRFRFDRVHDAFDKHVAADGNRVIQRSAERYISHVLGHAGPTIG